MIEAVIHVHNRTQYLARAVEAAVSSAKAADVVVRISSNANDATAREIAQAVAKQYDVNITYSLATSAYDHLLGSIAVSKAKHICLLHDDDFVSPRYFQLMQQLIAIHPGAAGYAPDANFLIEHSLHHASVSPQRPFKLSPRWLALLYLMGRCGPPFPCIVYLRDFAAATFARAPMFSKYSDTVIVIEAARADLWVHPELAFTYFLGDHNDSRVIDRHARRNLRHWLLRQMLKGPVSFSLTKSLANLEYFLGRFIKSRLSS
jgi:hypothetical protein